MALRNDALAEMDFAREDEAIQLSDFQQRACLVPEDFNLALTGSRGGGESYLICVLVMRHIVKYGDKARVLFVRTSHPGCEDFVMICRSLFGRVWGPAVRFNANDGIWRGFPDGGTLEISQLSNHGEYQKFQGRSFSLICCDELGQFATDELPSLLRSNLRGPAEVPKRMIWASNPCGVGHSWIYKKHVLRAVPWHPYQTEDGQTWVTAPSLFTDNPFIDGGKYRRDLEAACSFDGELLKAFRDGRWPWLCHLRFRRLLDAPGWHAGRGHCHRIGFRRKLLRWTPALADQRAIPFNEGQQRAAFVADSTPVAEADILRAAFLVAPDGHGNGRYLENLGSLGRGQEFLFHAFV
jgi:hypothetical protein